MRFLYYIGGKAACSREELCAAGLDYVFAGRGAFSGAGTSRGPDGGAGYLAAADVKGARPLACKPEEQTWRQVPQPPAPGPRPPVWVGFYNEQKPGPAELAREKNAAPTQWVEGHAVTLGDGKEWTVPLVRGFAESDGQVLPYVNLPRGSQLDDTGAWVRGEVLPPYRGIWKDAQAWMDQILGAMGPSHEGTKAPSHEGEGLQVAFDFAGLHEAAVRVLQVNYRLDAAEAAILELLSEENCVDIMNACCDLRGLALLSKKKASAAGG